MIASLSGKIDEKLDEQVIINVNGVGYGVYVCQDDYINLNIGDDTKLVVYEHVREQAHDLYGFRTRDNQNLFEKLLEVNGVGPKMALNLLSIGSTTDIKQAIASGNVQYIQSANGVGKRLAERIVVDLKDKVGLTSVDLSSTGLLNSSQIDENDEAVQALIALGFSNQDAAKALKGVDENLPTEERIKQALKTK